MIFVFFIVIIFNMLISYMKTKTVDGSIDNDRTNSIIYLAFIVFASVFDYVVYKFDIKVNFSLYIFTGIALSIFTIIVNAAREKRIEENRTMTKQIIQCLYPVLQIKEITDDIIESPPFKLEYDKNGKVENIKLEIGDNTQCYTDDNFTRIIYNLNKFLPYKKWNPDVDYPNLIAQFKGTKLPPSKCLYQGDTLRPWELPAVGVNGTSEITWNMNEADKKLAGDSIFFYEPEEGEKKRTRAKTVVNSSAPQCLIVGATGGGKAICSDQKVLICNR